MKKLKKAELEALVVELRRVYAMERDEVAALNEEVSLQRIRAEEAEAEVNRIHHEKVDHFEARIAAERQKNYWHDQYTVALQAGGAALERAEKAEAAFDGLHEQYTYALARELGKST